MTSEGSALSRFRRALAVRNGPAAYAAATELPRVELADALAPTLLLALEQGTMFDMACVRWIGRFAPSRCLLSRSRAPSWRFRSQPWPEGALPAFMPSRSC